MITKDNFKAELKEFLKLRPKDFVMIRPKYETASEAARGAEAMAAWWAYLGAKGFDKTRRFWDSQLANGKSVMVVCDKPGMFDVDYSAPAVAPSSSPCRNEERSEYITPERRQYIAEGVRRNLGIAAKATHFPRARDQARTDYAETPVTLSDEALGVDDFARETLR